MIIPRPTKERSRCDHRPKTCLNLSKIALQLSHLTSTKPLLKKTSRILNLLTHFKPRGQAPFAGHRPSHIASDLAGLSLASDPFSYLLTAVEGEKKGSFVLNEIIGIICILWHFKLKAPSSREEEALNITAFTSPEYP